MGNLKTDAKTVAETSETKRSKRTQGLHLYATRNEKHQRETSNGERMQQKVQYLPIQDKAEHAPREAANQRMTAQEKKKNNEKEATHH